MTRYAGSWLAPGAPVRCIDGRLWRHDPQLDDPDFEHDVGPCPECDGHGCDPEGADHG